MLHQLCPHLAVTPCMCLNPLLYLSIWFLKGFGCVHLIGCSPRTVIVILFSTGEEPAAVVTAPDPLLKRRGDIWTVLAILASQVLYLPEGSSQATVDEQLSIKAKTLLFVPRHVAIFFNCAWRMSRGGCDCLYTHLYKRLHCLHAVSCVALFTYMVIR